MKNKKYLITISILFLIFTGGIIQAEEYNFKELINQGLNNNLEIEQLEQDIENIKRDIKIAKSFSNWQAGLNLNKVLLEEDSIQISRDKDRLNVSLNKKNVEDRIHLKPTLSYNFDGSKIIYGVNINMNVYPSLPSENIKSLISLNNKLKHKDKQLDTRKAELVKKWIDKYLQLVRLQENVNILEDRYDITENEYEKIKEKVKIGEAGQQELLQGESDLKDVEYNFKKFKQQYLIMKKTLLNDLQLVKNAEIILNVENQLLVRLKNETTNIDIDKVDKAQLIDNIVKISSQFTDVMNQNNYLKKEINWLKNEDSIKVSVEGSYNSENQYSASINISYNVFDSGINELRLENKNEEIKSNELDLKKLYQETSTKLENILDQIELAEMDINRNELQNNKAADEIDIISRQYDSGVIEEEVLLNKKLNKRVTQLNLKRAKDKLFLNKLDLLILTEPDNIVKKFKTR